jgi:hypothetical protein
MRSERSIQVLRTPIRLPNAIVHGVTVARSFGVSAGGTLSSTASRTDTSYSYYNVGRIVGPGANVKVCEDLNRAGSSLFLRSELGIEDFLMQTGPVPLLFILLASKGWRWKGHQAGRFDVRNQVYYGF